MEYNYKKDEMLGSQIKPNYYKMQYKGENLDVFDLMNIILGEDNPKYSLKEIIYIFNILKYIIRYKNKNGIEDIKKVITYSNFLLEELQKQIDEKIETSDDFEDMSNDYLHIYDDELKFE